MIDWGLFTLILVLILLIVATCAGMVRIWIMVHHLRIEMLRLPDVVAAAKDAANGHNGIMKRLSGLESSVESVSERIKGVNARVSTVHRELNRALAGPDEDDDDDPGVVTPGDQERPAEWNLPAAPPQPPAPATTPANGLPPSFGRRI